MSFPGGAVKSPPCHAGDTGDVGPIPGSGRYPGGGNPPQCSCLGNPMDRGAWKTAVHGAAKFWTQPSRAPLAEPRPRCRSIGTTDVGGGDRTGESSVGKLGQGSTAAGEIRRRQSRADRAQEIGEGPDSGLGTGRGSLPGIWVASSSGQPSKVFAPPAHHTAAQPAGEGCSCPATVPLMVVALPQRLPTGQGGPRLRLSPAPLPCQGDRGTPPSPGPRSTWQSWRGLRAVHVRPVGDGGGGAPRDGALHSGSPSPPTARSYPEERFLPADWEIKVP